MSLIPCSKMRDYVDSEWICPKCPFYQCAECEHGPQLKLFARAE